MINNRTTLLQLAAIVSEHLVAARIEAVISGGAAATYWSAMAVQSYDIDFITLAGSKEIDPILATLGFQRRGKDFIHPDTKFFVEFPSGPLAVGNELATKADIKTVSLEGGKIRIVSATFSTMDRLSQFYHWNDRSALEQAVQVVMKNRVSSLRIKAWSQREGMSEKHEIYKKAVARQKKSR